MSFLQPAAPSPDAERMFDADTRAMGYLPNFTRVFAHSPATYAAWQQLNAAVKAGMELRRYELATLAAARALRSSYCGLAHGKVLRDRFFDARTVAAIASDHGAAGLSPQEVAVVDFAGKVAADASSVTEADVAGLRDHGLDDTEIFQVVLAAAARCFFSTVLSAAGAEPDPQYDDALDPELRQALRFGD
ncbi:carboxymuconolactone decarboxylase family protein [Micromonospora costi]|uniref:carboxymuconolactone decarboxylase family protein n=1 Tax=Micromonospora costi TaxID=1530042 RepID=UPI0033EEB1A0